MAFQSNSVHNMCVKDEYPIIEQDDDKSQDKKFILNNLKMRARRRRQDNRRQLNNLKDIIIKIRDQLGLATENITNDTQLLCLANQTMRHQEEVVKSSQEKIKNLQKTIENLRKEKNEITLIL